MGDALGLFAIYGAGKGLQVDENNSVSAPTPVLQGCSWETLSHYFWSYYTCKRIIVELVALSCVLRLEVSRLRADIRLRTPSDEAERS